MTGASPVTTIKDMASHVVARSIVVIGLAPVMLVCYLCYTQFGMVLAIYSNRPDNSHILCSVLHGIKTNTQRETQIIGNEVP